MILPLWDGGVFFFMEVVFILWHYCQEVLLFLGALFQSLLNKVACL